MYGLSDCTDSLGIIHDADGQKIAAIGVRGPSSSPLLYLLAPIDEMGWFRRCDTSG